MKIVDERKGHRVKYKDLEYGQVFSLVDNGGKFYIKATTEVAVNLETGGICLPQDWGYDEVEVFDAELIIRDN